MPEPAVPTGAGDSGRTRRVIARILVVVASLAAFLAIFSIWVNRQFLNTENWTQTSSRLLADPVIRNQVADYLVDQLYSNVDVAGELSSALPDRLKPLAGPAAGGLRNLAERQTRVMLSRPRAQQRWEDANRQAHVLLLAVLNGGGPGVSTNDGSVVLDLKTVLAETQQRVGVGGRVGKLLPASAARLVVLRSDQLKSAQTGFRILKKLPIVLVVLSLILFGVALAIAPDWRRRGVRAYGIGFVAAGAGALAAQSLLGGAVVDSLARTQAVVPAIEHSWTIATTLLRQAASAAIFYGAVMVLGAWLAGPMAWAVAVRRTLAPYLREPILAYGALAVILAVVVLWWAPTPAMHNPATALLFVVLVGLGFEALRRKTAREFPGADRQVVAARRRERMQTFYASTRSRAGAGAQTVVRQASSLTTSAGEQLAARKGNGQGTEPAPESRLDRLEQLGRLRSAGMLDEQEFNAEKARILAGDVAPAP